MEQTESAMDVKDLTDIDIMFIGGSKIQLRILKTQWEFAHRAYYNMDVRVIETDPYRTSYPVSVGTYAEDGEWAGTVYLNLMHISFMRELK